MGEIARTPENLKKCICKDCPSYTFACKVKNAPSNVATMVKDVTKAEHVEGMFCSFGNSKCIVEEKGCDCSRCDVWKENHLDRFYYCIVIEGEQF